MPEETVDMIWILSIEHRHGYNYYACEDEEAARQQLDLYVREWWETENYMNQDEGVEEIEMPDDRGLRIERYFEELADDEYYTMDCSPLYRKRPECSPHTEE